MKNIKARVLQFLAWLKRKFSAAGETIHEVSVAKEYEQQEPIRAPAPPTPPAPLPTPAPKEMRPRWDIASTPKRKTASKLGTVDPEAIVKSSRPSGRKPTRAQRRASTTK